MLWWLKSGQVTPQQEIGKRLGRDKSDYPTVFLYTAPAVGLGAQPWQQTAGEYEPT
jgi:hypothetical protein